MNIAVGPPPHMNINVWPYAAGLVFGAMWLLVLDICDWTHFGSYTAARFWPYAVGLVFGLTRLLVFGATRLVKSHNNFKYI